jgi:hypothetical protein
MNVSGKASPELLALDKAIMNVQDTWRRNSQDVAKCPPATVAYEYGPSLEAGKSRERFHVQVSDNPPVVATLEFFGDQPHLNLFPDDSRMSTEQRLKVFREAVANMRARLDSVDALINKFEKPR